jgi:hypothetical protein
MANKFLGSNAAKVVAIIIAAGIILGWHFVAPYVVTDKCTVDPTMDLRQMLATNPDGTSYVPKDFVVENGPGKPAGDRWMMLPSRSAQSYQRTFDTRIYYCRVRDPDGQWWAAARTKSGKLVYALSADQGPASK